MEEIVFFQLPNRWGSQFVLRFRSNSDDDSYFSLSLRIIPVFRAWSISGKAKLHMFPWQPLGLFYR
jgi:hypothetical protein